MAGADEKPTGLAGVVAHPERLQVLRALTDQERRYDPDRLSAELGLPPRVAAYHIEVLHTVGVLETYEADDDGRGGRS